MGVVGLRSGLVGGRDWGVVSVYGWGGFFRVQEESVCVGFRMPVQDGPLVWISRVGMAPVRIEVDRATLMAGAEAAVAEREREARRRDEPVRRAVLLGMWPIASGVFGWMAVYWRRSPSLWVSPPHGVASQVAFRGFLALNAIGALARCGDELRLRSLSWDEAIPAGIALAALCAVSFWVFGISSGRSSGGVVPERPGER